MFIFYELLYRRATPLRNLQFCYFTEAGEFTYTSFLFEGEWTVLFAARVYVKDKVWKV
jgi:hypothetical protein